MKSIIANHNILLLCLGGYLLFLELFVTADITTDPNISDSLFISKGKNFTLICSETALEDVTWLINGTALPEEKKKNIVDKIKYHVEKSTITDIGNYTCKSNDNTIKNWEVGAAAQVNVPSNIGVVEGENITIPCIVYGTHVKVEWEHDAQKINETDSRYEIIGDQNSTLKITNATLEDKGEYKCIGKNQNVYGKIIGKAEDKSFVRVKSKLAALWPFLGICAEVIVLCAIILIYEKKRNKTDLDESDTDPNTEQEKLKVQRK